MFNVDSEEKNNPPRFVSGSPNVIVSEPVKLTPFDNPEAFKDFPKKVYSKDEVISFWRYVYFNRKDGEYIGDCFDKWLERQKNKIWD